MKRRVEDWTIERLAKERPRIAFPEYQRQPNLWSEEKKRLLIDSILKDIDIPKLYFNRTAEGVLEVVDGTQRLWAIWDFVDGEYLYRGEEGAGKFSDLAAAQQRTILKYPLQITVMNDAPDEYLRQLFIRLQLGLLLVTGEKLNAATGAMKEFVFKKLAKLEFLANLRIPARRFARETLGAQIAVNSFTREKLGEFARTRYEDLEFFFKEYQDPQGGDLQFFRRKTKTIVEVIEDLADCMGAKGRELSNRSYILSVYLLFEEIRHRLVGGRPRSQFVNFVFRLWGRLKEESRAGIDRTNRELYSFETMLSSAPGEKYQIERRHTKLLEYFEYYQKTDRIVGEQRRRTG